MPLGKKKSSGKRSKRAPIPRNCNVGLNYNETESPQSATLEFSSRSPSPLPDAGGFLSPRDNGPLSPCDVGNLPPKTTISEPKDLNQAFCSLSNSYDSLVEKYDDLNAKYDRLDQKCDDLNAKYVRLDQKCDDLNAKYDRLDQKCDDLNAKYDHLDQKCDDLNAKYNRLSDQLKDTETQMSAQLKALEERTVSKFNMFRDQLDRLKEAHIQAKTESDDLLGVLQFNSDEQKTMIDNLKITVNKLIEENAHHKKTSESLFKELITLKRRDSDTLSTTVILSGSAIPTIPENSNLIPFTADLIANLTRHKMDPTDILSVEKFGKPSTSPNITDRRSLKLVLRSKEARSHLISIVLRSRPRDFYVNELLSNEVYQMYRSIRMYRKANRNSFQALFTRNGIIRVQMSNGKNYDIFSRQDLLQFTAQNDISLF